MCNIISFRLPSSRPINDSKLSRGTRNERFYPPYESARVRSSGGFQKTAVFRKSERPHTSRKYEAYVQQRGNKTKTLIFRPTRNARFKRLIANIIIDRGVRNKSYFAFTPSWRRRFDRFIYKLNARLRTTVRQYFF